MEEQRERDREEKKRLEEEVKQRERERQQERLRRLSHPEINNDCKWHEIISLSIFAWLCDLFMARRVCTGP
jgi:hypothetical protein